MSQEETRKKIVEELNRRIEKYIDDECYDHQWEGFLSTCDRLFDEYIEKIEDDEVLVSEILADCDIDDTEENKKLLVELAKGL